VASLLFGIYIARCRCIYLKLQKPVLSSTSKEDKDSEENSKSKDEVKKSLFIVSLACCSRNSNCKWNTGDSVEAVSKNWD
jgi:hypothetical protein